MKRIMFGLVFLTPFCKASDNLDTAEGWPKASKVIYLKAKDLTKIPAGLNLPELTILLLSGNKIKAIPADLKFPKLIRLYLDNNHITEIPEGLELQSLNTLDLTKNSIRFINAQQLFKQFPKLTRLILLENLISQENIGKLRIAAVQHELKSGHKITIEADYDAVVEKPVPPAEDEMHHEVPIRLPWDGTLLEYGFCEELDEIYQRQWSRL